MDTESGTLQLPRSRANSILKRVRREKISIVRFQFLGNDLTPRAMACHSKFLKDAIKNGIGVPRALQSFDMTDKVAPGARWGPESSEFKIIPDVSTFVPIPYAPGSARMIGELHNVDLRPSETDARHFLGRVVSKARKLGYLPMASFEAEFYILRRDNGNLVPLFHHNSCSAKSFEVVNDFIQEMTEYLEKMNVKLERLKKEGGPSQIEPILRYANALKASDDVVTMRDIVKFIASKRNLIATFMPKPLKEYPGSGMHLHISLLDHRTRRNVFYDTKDSRGLRTSRVGYSFVAGLLEHMKAISVFGAPLVNSYKRLLPGTWAPAHVSYGFDNRAVAIRIPSLPPRREGASQRIEYRLPDPSANPYLALGTAIAAGLDGIERGLDPGEPLQEDPDQLSPAVKNKRGIELLPRNLGEAITKAREDRFLKQLMGDIMLPEYLKVRESEWNEYSETVTDWEERLYLESI